MAEAKLKPSDKETTASKQALKPDGSPEVKEKIKQPAKRGRPAKNKNLVKTATKVDEEVEGKKPTRSRRGAKQQSISPPKRSGRLKGASSETSEEKDEAEDKNVVKNKVSMITQIFRAKKREESKNADEKKNETGEKATKKDVVVESDNAESGSESSDQSLASSETDKLIENKRTAVIGGKLMIPADKLQIPDELCKIKFVGKANKKNFICEICEKSFNRADKIKYHLYNEHYEDFIRCCDSVPKILKKNLEAQGDSKSPTVAQPAKEKKVSALGRIFKKKDPPKPLSVLAPKGSKAKGEQNGPKKVAGDFEDSDSTVDSKVETQESPKRQPKSKVTPERPKSEMTTRRTRTKSPQVLDQSLLEDSSPPTSPPPSSPVHSSPPPSTEVPKDEIPNFDSDDDESRDDIIQDDIDDIPPPVLKPVIPSPTPVVEKSTPKKRGRKRKEDTLVEMPIVEPMISTRRTRAMSEQDQDLTPPAIVDDSGKPIDTTPEKLKSSLKSKSQNTSHSELKVTFNLPEPLYDADGNEIRKERRKLVESSPVRFPKDKPSEESVESVQPEEDDGPKFGMNKDMITFADLAFHTKIEEEKLELEMEQKRIQEKSLDKRKEVSKPVEKPKKVVEKAKVNVPEKAEVKTEDVVVTPVVEKEQQPKDKTVATSVEKSKLLDKPKEESEDAKSLPVKKQPPVVVQEKARPLTRKKVSTRLSIEQSIIEDTPSLIALQATNEASVPSPTPSQQTSEPSASQETVSIEITPVILEPVPEAKETESCDTVSLEDDEENVELPESLKLLLGESNIASYKDSEGRSKPTRSKVQVDTIGLTSSTLDLELHALRKLVFGEILHDKYESASTETQKKKASESVIVTEKADITEEKKIVTEVKSNESVEEILGESEAECEDPVPRKTSRVSKFIRLTKEMNKLIPSFASKLWHHRKRLRQKKAAEFRNLRDKQPSEKQHKFKPKRYDYSINILCRNNLYDNALVTANLLLKNHEDIYEKFLIKRPFFPPRYRKYKVEKGSNDTTLKLKKKQKSLFQCFTEAQDLKLKLTRQLSVTTTEKTENLEKKNDSVVVPAKKDVPPAESPVTTGKLRGRGRPPKHSTPIAKTPTSAPVTPPTPVSSAAQPKDEPKSVTTPATSVENKPKLMIKTPTMINMESILLKNVDGDDKMPSNVDKTAPTTDPVTKTKEGPDNIQEIENKSFDSNDMSKEDSAPKRRGRPKKNKSEVLEINQLEVTKERKEEVFDFISEETSILKQDSEDLTLRKRGRKRKILNVKHSKEWKDKKCRLSGEISSEGEEQVPLKITFKRPVSSDDGSGNKSIKLRVKTQTKSDHSFNIQIKQPKTDNPVKFVVKPTGELRKKKNKSLDDIAERLAKKSKLAIKSSIKEKNTEAEENLSLEKVFDISSETSNSPGINGTQILEEVVNKSESVSAVTSSPTLEVASNQVGSVVPISAAVAPLSQVESSALAFSGKIILTKIEFHLTISF